MRYYSTLRIVSLSDSCIFPATFGSASFVSEPRSEAVTPSEKH